MRKGAPMEKVSGGARAPPVPEVSSLSRAAHVPEQRSLGCGAGDFFNGSDDFFGSPEQSSQPWNPQSSDPAMWGTNATPPGGFTNFIQPNMSQNFIFGGQPSQYAPFRQPRNMQDVQSEEEFSTPISAKDNNPYVNVDSGEEAPRTEKRIFWSQEEDVRMISSWLLNSTDPTCGADRKNEQYWSDVEVTYNETTPSHRARNAKQIKDRFHKVNRWTDLFHSAWLKARMIYTSGYNDLMWIEKAHVFYIEDNKKLNLGPFVLMEVWNTVKNEAKWITYNNGLKAARKRKGPGNEKEGEAEDHTDVDELDDQPRPMGQKLAKKLKYATIKDVNHIDLEELDKFGKIQDEQNASRLKVLEVQQKLSSEKIEQTKLAHLAAKEQKEVA
ncbi:glutathione S-transferase T3-like [Panicum hallii]|uniref:glutathione S-transferase T3-like n=1 Tax=Panicum hallii TaxID=206008 RepID=UPI000DF4DE5B|nr:glutathione S-transferase T3-like [Panicum hallii]